MNRSMCDAVPRVKKVFQFLSEYALRNQPFVSDYREQLWHLELDSLPEHPCITRPALSDEVPDGPGRDPVHGSEGALLIVERPRLIPPPEPPPALEGWVVEGWQRGSGEPEVRPERELPGAGPGSVPLSGPGPGADAGPDPRPGFEHFADDARRPQAFAHWRRQWEAWRERERPALAAHEVYESLYTLHARIKREGEAVELVLADGVLHVAAHDTVVAHPLLLLRVELVFDASTPAIRVEQADREPELLGRLLAQDGELDQALVGELRADLALHWYHPLDGERTSAFFTRIAQMIHAQGSLSPGPFSGPVTEVPVISREPMLLLRRRDAGLHLAFERVLEDLATAATVPVALSRLVGVELPPEPETADGIPRATAPWGESEDILLSKPANPEQVRIARALERHGAVLVQGPPGTGKTHTIANLIGHLVAQGKRVLVTSHTTKALRVLKGKVEPRLQPLCISVLDSDGDSRKQMEASVRDILNRLTTDDPETLEEEARAFAHERAELLELTAQLTLEIRDAREGQYRDIDAAGEPVSPASAARWVAGHAAGHAWLPGPLVAGAACPLATSELERLHELNGLLGESDADALEQGVPDPANLPSADTFRAWCDARGATVDPRSESLWEDAAAAGDVTALTRLAAWLERTATELSGVEGAALVVAGAGAVGGADAGLWEELCERIERVHVEWQAGRKLLLDHRVELPEGDARVLAERHLGPMLAHLRSGGGFGGLTDFLHGAWKKTRAELRVNGVAPRGEPELLAMRAALGLQAARETLRHRWTAQSGPAGYPTWDQLGEPPEPRLKELELEIRALLSWHHERRSALAALAEPVRLDLAAADARMGSVGARVEPLRREHRLIVDVLAPAARNRLALARREQCARQRQELLTRLEAHGPALVQRLCDGLLAWDADAYAREHEALAALWALRPLLAERDALLAKVQAVAPAWARALHVREGVHAALTPPGDAGLAWRWRQLQQALAAREALDEPRLMAELHRRCEQVRQVTTQLIDRRGWLSQARRTTLEARQALQGWSDTVQRIGKGTGKRAPELRQRAQELLASARDAVPVWIMPFARVVESINPASQRFDVVIIDEASQADLAALLTWYIADRVVVVGDHEQVSPLAVGQNIEDIQALRAEYLAGIPNHDLYDGKLSVFHLARQCFGGTIALREHFRCVPDIIEFSNGLAYEFQIEPLRSAEGVPGPHVAEYLVRDGVRKGKVNVPEARAIVALMRAMVEDPAYASATFGAVSLLGDEQAAVIEELALREIGSTELERREFLAGNAAQFQGDERTVVFLSMVDSPGSGPLTLSQRDEIKQRYNVAASRARDQLWLVHGLDPARDLKPGDLRRRLIEHVREPGALRAAVAGDDERAGTAFESEVAAALASRGYRVQRQARVGGCRIGMVVEGRIALECDGDRVHPPAAVANDLERQAILERAGWRFVRIRGTRYFADPGRTLEQVFRELERLGVRPTAAGGAGARGDAGERHAALLERAGRYSRSLREVPGPRAAAPSLAGEPATGQVFAVE